ncbi:glycosyltransferase family 4 protein [Sediminitomix flava]|uniref:Glycosyltransferase involved in cell wall biosynthesis n=1 Tax=Sediminitomix flava TaxID=379075 RepID=A0A315Z9Q7_SEDFL|nr:glycosyltransferase family 4 protein [Sediminitomix flava]PWJ40934.1 glycosyltransferase involved in cell wall biosynthesis [Sediminitomix flava]
MSSKSILIVGPFSPPITGVSFANDVLYDNLVGYKKNKVNFSFPELKENLGTFSFRKVLKYILVYRTLWKLFKVDILYITPGQTFFGILKYSPFILLAKILEREIVLHVHGNYLGTEFKNLKGIKKKIFKLLISFSDKGIVLSQSLRGNLTPFIDDSKIFELPNFVDSNLFGSDSKETEELKLLYMSNLMEEKGINEFLEALSILKNKGVNYSAKIAGQIDLLNKERLLAIIKDLEDNVEYLGVVKGNEKRNLLWESNIFVFPTYYKMEGQPISILEAMATGNIILTCEHAGIPDIFKPGVNGFYIEKKSSESIANQIEEIYNNLPMNSNMINFNIDTTQKEYTIERFINGFTRIINY